MADHNIKIKVSQDSSRPSTGTFQKNQLDQAKALQGMRQAAEKSGSGIAGFQGSSEKELNKNLKALIKVQSEQIREMKKNKIGGGGHSGGVLNKIASGGGVGAAIGSIGSSMPVGIGVGVAIAGFVAHQIMEVGKAYMSKVSEQQSTMGIAGLQTGRIGKDKKGNWVYGSHYNAAQLGEYEKARRMGSGEFNTSGNDNFAMRYAKRFGIGSGELGKQIGIMDMATGGKGGNALNRILATAYKSDSGAKKGQNTIGTELPLMISAISQSMEDAIKNGMDASSISKDMAKEIAHISKYSQNGSIQGTLQGIQALSSIQQQVGQGNIGGSMNQWGMYQAGTKFSQSEFAKGAGKGKSEYVNKLIEHGIITKEEAAKYQKNPGSFSYLNQKYLSERVNAENNPEVRSLFDKSIMTGGMGKAGSLDNRASTKAYLQQMGYDITNYDARYNAANNIKSKINGVSGKDIANAKNAMVGGTQGDWTGVNLKNLSENFMLTSTATKKAAESVYVFEEALIKAASSMEGAFEYMINKINGDAKKEGILKSDQQGRAASARKTMPSSADVRKRAG